MRIRDLQAYRKMDVTRERISMYAVRNNDADDCDVTLPVLLVLVSQSSWLLSHISYGHLGVGLKMSPLLKACSVAPTECTFDGSELPSLRKSKPTVHGCPLYC